MAIPSNTYRIVTRWRVPGTCEEVYAILEDTLDLPRWWPDVFLEVAQIEPPTPARGAFYRLLPRGWRPSPPRGQVRPGEKGPPHCIRLEASGDFNGGGLWELEQDGGEVAITYTWDVVADKP